MIRINPRHVLETPHPPATVQMGTPRAAQLQVVTPTPRDLVPDFAKGAPRFSQRVPSRLAMIFRTASTEHSGEEVSDPPAQARRDFCFGIH